MYSPNKNIVDYTYPELNQKEKEDTILYVLVSLNYLDYGDASLTLSKKYICSTSMDKPLISIMFEIYFFQIYFTNKLLVCVVQH